MLINIKINVPFAEKLFAFLVDIFNIDCLIYKFHQSDIIDLSWSLVNLIFQKLGNFKYNLGLLKNINWFYGL